MSPLDHPSQKPRQQKLSDDLLFRLKQEIQLKIMAFQIGAGIIEKPEDYISRGTAALVHMLLYDIITMDGDEEIDRRIASFRQKLKT